MRVTQELLRVAVAAGRERDPDAGVQRGLASVRQADGFGDDPFELDRALGDRLDAGDVAAHDDELVAGDAPDAVHCARRALQSPGDFRQDLVTTGMAEGVVHELEPVDVDEQHGGVRLHAATARERVLQAVDENHAVAQARELVVGCAVAQLLLGLDHLGHVGERADRARGRARHGRQRPAAQREPALRVVGHEPDEHVLHRLVAGQRAGDGMVGERNRPPVGADDAVGPGDAVDQSAADLGVEREDAARGRVGVDDDPVRVGNDDALVHRLDDRAVKLLDRAALVLGAPAFGRVRAHDDEARPVPTLVEDVRHRRADDHEVAVEAPVHRLDVAHRCLSEAGRQPDEIVQRRADGDVARDAVDQCRGAVPALDPTARVDADDRVRDVLDEVRLIPQRGLGALAVGEVAQDHLVRVLAFPTGQHAHGFDQPRRSVEPHQRCLGRIRDGGAFGELPDAFERRTE